MGPDERADPTSVRPDDVRRREVDRLLTDLLDAQPEERRALLDRIEDSELRSEVETMLADALADDDFLRPGGALDPALLEGAVEGLEDASGRTLGSYRLRSPLGRGGMGVVYLAERSDGRFEREVAIKVLRLDGPLADRRRFHREQQILASLTHPGIARLYDGGLTEEGDPYFVMEHVDGEPLDRYCERHALSLRERIGLMVEICEAVQAAHRRLVVHRDLKPSNILVDAEGRPRLLDFGIAGVEDAARYPAESESDPDPYGFQARVVPPSMEETLAGASRMTLRYASPEQLRQEPASVASDVYQLGLLLYELVTGGPARSLEELDLDGLREMVEELPKPPSKVSSRIPAGGRRVPPQDLDAVVLRALSPHPADRYSSAEGLCRDLEHLLAGRPVAARRATPLYVATRIVGRHPLVFSVGTAAVLLVVGLVIAFTVRLARERDATREQAERAEESLAFVTSLFRQAGPERGAGPDTTARELLDHGARRIRQRLGDRPLVKARILTEIGSMYRVLGLWEEAEDLLEEGLDLRRRSLLESQEDGAGASVILPADSAEELAKSWLELGRLAESRGDLERASDWLGRTLSALEGRERSSTRASALTTLGSVLRQQQRLAEAEETHRRALLEYRELGDRQATAGEEVNLANVLVRSGRTEESRELLEGAVESLREVDGGEVATANALMNLATLEARVGSYDRSAEILEEAAPVLAEAYGPGHVRLAMLRANQGNVFSRLGHHGSATESLRESLEILRALPSRHYLEGTVLMNLGVAESRLDRWHEAESAYRGALAIFREHRATGGREVPLALYNLGNALRIQGRGDEALPLLEESRTLFREALGEDHVLLSHPLLEEALIHAEAGDRSRADRLFRRAIVIRESAEDVDPEAVEEVRSAYEEFLGAAPELAETGL